MAVVRGCAWGGVVTATRVRRIVDPIDGTTNFVHSVPLSVVSIGVAHRGELVAGVIYEPYRDELFSAMRGGGAHLNGRPIHVSVRETKLSESYLYFGTHSTARVREPMLKAVGHMASRVRAVRSLGSAAIHLAWIAAGRGTGFWELDLNSWDLAAGIVLITEAGGRVTDTRGEPATIRTRDILASTGQGTIHDDVVANLVAIGCASLE
jgi:myo-inositol-1(or 4)-monophosphatase